MRALRVQPLSFGAATRPLFGFLHAPVTSSPARDIGLLICKPFGYEAICTDRSLRHFADAAAGLGIPALRFDYDGTGDSAGDDRDPGRWQAWLTSVHLAIDELRRRGQVDRICLLGTRLGATLAATAAAQRDDVAALIAIAPVVTGRTWLRELHALEMAMGFAGPPPGYEYSNGHQESVGFVIADETKAALQSIDLLKMSRQPATDVLILDRDDLPPNVKWVERLGALGACVDHRRVPGYAEMMLEPHESAVPTKMIAAASGWLEQRAGISRVASDVSCCGPRMVGPLAVAPGVEETAGYIDETRTLFGVVSAPSDAAARSPKRALVLLNAGANSHIGPSRMYVDLARRWAARGYLVLRFDQAGIGESRPFTGERENVVYSRSAVRGVAEALAYLTDSWGITECQALGICSGAYHALKAAAAGLPLKGVAIVNPLVFFWKDGMSLKYPPYQVAGDAARYKQSFLQLEKWRKFLAGKVSVRTFARVIARRVAVHAMTGVRDIARALGRPLPEDLGTELASVANRGVALRFIFATGDPGEHLLRSDAGSALRKLLRNRRLRIQRIEGPNHSFTRLWTRVLLTDVLETELELQ